MTRALATALTGLLLAGCASLPPGPRDPRDPWERFNRSMYVVNDTLDRDVAKPVAKGYVKVLPQPIRKGVGNFFNNLDYASTTANSLLQGKFGHFANDFGRFVVNSTLGLGGLFDPATQFGLATHDEDLGQTLGYWGMPSGPYLMRPIFGPSSLRDTFGDLSDFYIDPKYYVNSNVVKYGLVIQELVQDRAELLSTDQVLENAYDPYSFIRNAYLQRREYQVKDGAVDSGDVEVPVEEDIPQPEAAPAR